MLVTLKVEESSVTINVNAIKECFHMVQFNVMAKMACGAEKFNIGDKIILLYKVFCTFKRYCCAHKENSS